MPWRRRKGVMLKKFAKKILGSGSNSEKEAASPSGKRDSAPSSRKRKSSGENKPDKKQPERRKWSPDDFLVEPCEGETRFHDFDLPGPIMHAISDLGFKYCTPIQTKVLNQLGRNRNIAGRAQTGTGKTAAFLISIFSEFWNKKYGIQKTQPGRPRALVLAPTRELCLQIAGDSENIARYTRFRTVAVYGGKDFDRQRMELREKPVDLIAGTPGRLLDCLRRRMIDLKSIDTLVIDETDRMLDMGFIPDVRRIISATPPKHKRQTLLFSATLTQEVLRLASQWAPDPVFCEVDPEEVVVETVKQTVYAVQASNKFDLLCGILNKHRKERVLIFRNRRDSTNRLYNKLKDRGLRVAHLSGSVDQERRLKALDNFRRGAVKIVVATDVAGRGIHVDNIALVINYDFPYEAEDYVHRIGRTGRAHEEGEAISFACENESFVIPEIEAYIGKELKCTVPDPNLFEKNRCSRRTTG